MRLSALIALLAASVAAPTLAGQRVFHEDFEGGRARWHLTSGGSVAVEDDGAGIGSGKALFLSVEAGSTQRRLVAGFPPVELTNASDRITLRFDFRITGSPTATRGTGDARSGFRFGLLDSKATPQTQDSSDKGASANAADDVGYLAMLSVGAHGQARLAEERAEDKHLMGGPDLHYHHSDESFGGIADSDKHSAALTITRVSDSALRMELAVDGKKPLSGEVASGPRSRFDELGFAGSNNFCNFVIDNVEVVAEKGSSSSKTTGSNPTVRGRCDPCTIEVGKTLVLSAEGRGSGGAVLKYSWDAPTGKFQDATAPTTAWRAPVRGGWTEERWQKEGDRPLSITVTVEDDRGGTASDTVAVLVVRPRAK